MSRHFKQKRHSRSRSSQNNSRNGFHKQHTSARPSRKRNKQQNLDVKLFINKAQPQEVSPEYVVESTFADFPFQRRLQENIAARGFTQPTPIQDQAMSHILNGRDVLGIANTGTGKTGAFLLPLIEKISKNRGQKVLVLAPTRELALQIEDELRLLTPNMNIRSILMIGGTSMRKQESQLRKKFDFVIGTPGRITDLKRQRIFSTHTIETVVLDEVDRMLDMGFVKDVSEIISDLAPNRHSLFFSATMEPAVLNLIEKFSKNIHTVSVKVANTAKTIDQDIIRLEQDRSKLDTLHDLLRQSEMEKVIIFGRTKYGVQKLSNKLSQRGFRTDAIHGNKTQNQRQRALKSFRTNKINILVATDVAARGIDVEDISHVINYDVPGTYDDYVHRIGRTGRANKTGKALTFVE